MLDDKIQRILTYCLSLETKGHFNTSKTTKVLQCRFCWPTLFLDIKKFISNYDQCQRTRNISRIDEMPLIMILEIELFNFLRINFMRLFLMSYENHYILVTIDYMSKWVKAMTTLTTNAKVVVNL